jgi:PKD repeat protein
VATATITVTDTPPDVLAAVGDTMSVDLADLTGGNWITLPYNLFTNDTDAGTGFNLLQLDGYKGNGLPTTAANFDNSGRLKTWSDNGGLFRIGSDGTVEFKDRDNDFAGLAEGDSIAASIGYVIGDGTDTSTAPISLIITNGEAGPPNTAPTGTGIVLDPGEDMATDAPHLVTFESDVTDAEGHALTYAWDFGDGTTSDLAAPSHTYSAIGLYSVSLTVTDELGASTAFDSVAIDVGNAPPVAVDDAYTLPLGFDPVTNHIHILMNDYDPDGALNPQMVEVISGPSFGTIEIIDTEQELIDRGMSAGHYGHAEYAPTDPSLTGTDSFTYRVQDDEGAWSNVATATITVTDPGTPVETPGALLSVNNGSGVDVQDLTITGDYTVEFWAAFETGSNLNKYDAAITGGVYDSAPGDDSATDGVFGNDLNFHAGKMRLYSTESTGSSDVIVANTAVAADGVWNHFALVREGDDFSIYLNGVLDATSTNALAADLVIEKLATNVRDSKALGGTLDELRLWDDARSATEISDYFDQVIDASEPDLLRYYQFNDEDGVIDSTGNAEQSGDLLFASITGAEWTEADVFVL